MGRKKTIEFCCRAVSICDEFWLFGISEGCLAELLWALEYNEKNPKTPKIIKCLYKKFDPEWQKYYKQIKDKYSDPLAKIK